MFRLPSPLPDGKEAAVHLALDFLSGGWEEIDGEGVPPEAGGRGAGGGGGGGAVGQPAAKHGSADAASAAGGFDAAAAAKAAVQRVLALLQETELVLRVTAGLAGAVVLAMILVRCSRVGGEGGGCRG